MNDSVEVAGPSGPGHIRPREVDDIAPDDAVPSMFLSARRTVGRPASCTRNRLDGNGTRKARKGRLRIDTHRSLGSRSTASLKETLNFPVEFRHRRFGRLPSRIDDNG